MSNTLSNTPSTGGYLPQIASINTSTLDLINIIQTAVAGVTGLPPSLVRPRWQPQPPTQPIATTDWCAVGIENIEIVDYPFQTLDPDGLSMTLSRQERINVLASLYGPQANLYAGALRDAFYVDQNFTTLAEQGISFRGAEDIVQIPELINSQYVSRYDLRLTFFRMVNRGYEAKSILGAEVDIIVEDGDELTVILSQET